MFQVIKRILLVIISTSITLILAVAGNYAYLGYKMYSSAIEEKSVSEMASDIKCRCDFAEYSELPEFYVNAVISAEDKKVFSS